MLNLNSSSDTVINSSSPFSQAAFEAQFGVTFTAACASGRLVNCAEFLSAMPEDSRPPPFDLETQWRSGACVKLFPGTYVASVGESIVVNGFFPAMNAKFVDPTLAPRGIRWFAVSWDEDNMSWEDFRAAFVGATNPAKAAPDSLRGHVFANWEQLGLAKVPYGADNGFHASASPVEAAYELGIWLGTQVEDTAFYKRCVAEGVDAAVAKSWASGSAEVARGENGGKIPVFDAVEHMNMSACLELMKQLHNLI